MAPKLSVSAAKFFGGAMKFGSVFVCAVLLGTLAGCGGGGGGDSASNAGTGTSGTGSSLAAPTISGTPASQVQVGQAYSFSPTAGDPGASLAFSIQNKPSWATFSIATGQLSGTPTSAQTGSYSNIVITVSNGSSSASLPAFAITVVASNGTGTGTGTPSGTATLRWTQPVTNTNGSSLTDLAGYIIDYGTTASNLNQSVSITSPATTSYTLQDLTAGTWYFAIVAYTTEGTQSPLSNVVSAAIQ